KTELSLRLNSVDVMQFSQSNFWKLEGRELELTLRIYRLKKLIFIKLNIDFIEIKCKITLNKYLIDV
ncbi:hypothetical protein RFK20_08625, partial [Streptococcus suis]|uniref:hypothetical protein n=1 Tax=Streptococcus suis TaxID=1307 RepID=UPI002FC75B53